MRLINITEKKNVIIIDNTIFTKEKVTFLKTGNKYNIIEEV